jgi:ribosomal protein S18 acetylase RimI-like enzyme
VGMQPELEFQVVPPSNDTRRAKRKRPAGVRAVERVWTLEARSPLGTVGAITFVPDKDSATVRTVSFEVSEHMRRQGVARAMTNELLERFPAYELVEGPDSNSEAGQALLDRLRSDGAPYHHPPCFTTNGCLCSLRGRVRSEAS